MFRCAAPVPNQYYSAQHSVQYYSVPKCYLMPKLFVARSSTATLRYTVFVIIHECHQQSSVFVSVLCSKPLLCVSLVSTLCYQVKPVLTLCTLRLLPTYKGGERPMRPSVLRRGEFMWYFSLPSC